ncbi:N-acetyltransferase [Shimia sp. SDUM112013]|uniref:GNAT family N-acetyltransferase n=1 Tax=Shimia sp. SDUM112013 TaxID=3136160 RepID=UPI0032EBB3E2
MMIRACTPAEAPDIRALLSAAFGQVDEAELVESLREAGDMALELVAEHKKRVVGYVALSRMAAPAGWLALAPVATDPKLRRKGIGSALCQMAMQYANAPVVVLGEPAFYGRIGFDFARAKRMTSPFPLSHTGLYAPDLAEAQPQVKLTYAAPFIPDGV